MALLRNPDTITTQNLRKSEIDMDWGGSITHQESHFLLSEFNQLQSSLYFEGHAANPEVIFHELYRIHEEKYGTWIRFGWYFNGGLDLVKLLSSRNGLLVQGPKDILETYARVLTTHGINTNFVLDHHDRDMFVLRGKINSLTHDFTNQLSGVTYKSRLNVSSNWANHATLANLQTWINSNISGDELSGTKYWIKCIPAYKPGYDDEAINVLSYFVL